MEKQNKVDEKLKWMNTTYLEPIVMCQCKLYLFTTKRFVSTETLHGHLQEICSHWELKQYEAHSQYHFTLFFIWIQFIKPFMYNIILTTWRRKLHSFPHFHPNLLAPSFFIATIHLQLLHIYFTMEKQKCIEMVTPNTLETMIEYTLISKILDRICKMTIKHLERSNFDRPPKESPRN